jgi:uncharacterized LabA/DUF88 family protein
MRVALFFDGKNHFESLRRVVEGRAMDHAALAKFIVERVGGTRMVGAWYYTGLPDEAAELRALGKCDRKPLEAFLDRIERLPGFFVRRFPRRLRESECPHCGGTVHGTEEKQVDTSLVADAILMAVRDAYDIAVVFSGDLDVTPALDVLQGLGKPGYVATFGTVGLARGLARAAYEVIDLYPHLDLFASPAVNVDGGMPASHAEVDSAILRELTRAHEHFSAGGGFVGAQYFFNRWRGPGLPATPELRRASAMRLQAAGLVAFDEIDGKLSLRPLGAAPVTQAATEGGDDVLQVETDREEGPAEG